MKIKKALFLVEEERVYKLHETDQYIYFICKGNSIKPYEIRYDKKTNHWSCDCMNCRHVFCKHILACHLYLEEKKEDTEV